MLSGKTALIIGATSDMGDGIANRFAAWGVAKMILHGRDKPHLKRIADDLRSKQIQITEIGADLLNAEEYRELKSSLHQIGNIDIFVYTPGYCGDMDPVGFINFDEDYLKVFHVNMMTCAELFEICVQNMRDGAAAVFISSTNSRDALECGSAYCATKCSMKTFMQEKALELGERGIRVNTVAPGLVDTKMHQAYFSDGELKEYIEQEMTAHPLGRIATVDGVANAVAFLCSERASDITGTEMVIDCGASLVEPKLDHDSDDDD